MALTTKLRQLEARLEAAFFVDQVKSAILIRVEKVLSDITRKHKWGFVMKDPTYTRMWSVGSEWTAKWSVTEISRAGVFLNMCCFYKDVESRFGGTKKVVCLEFTLEPGSKTQGCVYDDQGEDKDVNLYTKLDDWLERDLPK